MIHKNLNLAITQHKNWKIEKIEFGYYAATNLEDCDEPMKFSKSIDELKTEIDEEL